MKKLILGIFFTSLFIFTKAQSTKLLIEAESFEEKGGWLVDQQFVEQMGSPYLLAHGLGIQVANARKTITVEKQGEYHVWARTMDWAPGNWNAPGRFKLVIDKQELQTELGTETGWNWQYAGVVTINNKTVIIELKDLTGFDGRCDAIYLSTEKQLPPNEKDELCQWRKKMLNESEEPLETKDFDLVIVGGGIAGCAAAIASAEQGLKVALIHDRPLLGGNASSEIRVHTLGITWKYSRILEMINTEHYPNGSPKAKIDQEKRHGNIEKYKNIALYLNWRAYGANSENNLITSIDARHTSTGKRLRFNAPLFVDCTGDGWVGYWSGAEYMYGRESADSYDEAWKKHGELWSPDKSDNFVMGSSVLWRTKKTDKPEPFTEVPWAVDVAKNHTALNGEWYWEFSRNDLHQIDNAEEVRDHMLRAIYGSFYNAKQDPENANYKLEWVSYLLGKRESRRLVGDYIYTFQDVKLMKEFKDSVVKERRDVDIHFQSNLVDPDKPDFYSKALFYHVDHYYIPYRSLYSKNIENLFMAGRCFSCSHIGLGGPRVMNTTGQMGAAVGYAASVCKKYSISPREVYNKYLDEYMQLVESSDDKLKQ